MYPSAAALTSDETGDVNKPGKSLSQRYVLIADGCGGGKRDRDAAGDHRNLDEVKFTGAGRAPLDETPEASLLKHGRIGETDGNAR